MIWGTIDDPNKAMCTTGFGQRSRFIIALSSIHLFTTSQDAASSSSSSSSSLSLLAGRYLNRALPPSTVGIGPETQISRSIKVRAFNVAACSAPPSTAQSRLSPDNRNTDITSNTILIIILNLSIFSVLN